MSGPSLCLDQAELFSNHVHLSGWAISDKGRDGIERIEVYLDECFMANAIYGHVRLDVGKAYSSIKDSDFCGFHYYAEVPDFQGSDLGKHHITVKAIGIDGESTEIMKHCVNNYQHWIKENEPDGDELNKQQQTTFAYAPLISIIASTHNTHEEFLIHMIESVLHQTYSNWKLYVIQFGRQEKYLKETLEFYKKRDERINIKHFPVDQTRAEILNAALELTTGAYITFLDQEDTLPPFALFEIVKNINDDPTIDCIYADEDMITDNGNRCGPLFKPNWSPDTLRSYNYIKHFQAVSKDLIELTGKFREGFEGGEDYDFILRASNQAKKIVHIPKVLYHRRINEVTPTWKTTSNDSMKRALKEHLQGVGLEGTVADGLAPDTYKITYVIHDAPLISIIIPNKDHSQDLKRCINSIVTKSSYTNYEIIIVENGSTEEETFQYYEKLQNKNHARIINWDRSFNYSEINNFAVTHSRGEILLFLNNDTEVINPDWLERMVEHVQREGIGAVGAKLYYPDDTIQHAGVILGLYYIAGHCFNRFSKESSGYGQRLKVIQNLSVVTGACLMMRKEVFEKVQGLDKRYAITLNDVDLCMRLRENGYLIIWTPYAELYHYEAQTRSQKNDSGIQKICEKEFRLFKKTWGHILETGDPYYNPNLSLDIIEGFLLKTCVYGTHILD